ncbi:MAG: hypothetical protein BIFFINMI_00704 [Phycisphaerae bacterium]|nr:hypothetical protein [Phycisphaerae bacterium]
MKRLSAFVVVLTVLLAAATAGASVITGLNTDTSYGLKNSLHQWEFGVSATTSRSLGRVDLTAAFGYDIRGADVAMLSDGRVAITHRDSANTKWQVSILQTLYDSGGLLTGANINTTMDVGATASRLAPLQNQGFVVATNGVAVVFNQTAANSWSGTSGTIASTSSFYDVAGLKAGTTDFVIGTYASAPGSSAARTAWEYTMDAGNDGAHDLLGKYYDSDYSKKGWGYNGTGEGLNTGLLSNGFIVSNDGDSTDIGSVLFNATATDGAWHDNAAVGEILDASGAKVLDRHWAATSDGRVISASSGGWTRSDTDWQVFTLVANPNFQPSGSIGATGKDYQVTLGGGAAKSQNGAASGVFVGRVAGDYMVVATVPEPATLSLLLLGGAVLVGRRRMRRRAAA